LKGTIDLALETHFLASLSHNHILSLRGRSQNAIWEWSGNALEESSPLDHLGYFIVLDRLQETLSKRLVAWMHQQRATQGLTGLVCAGGPRGKQRKVTKLYLDRLLVAFDIANAMDYLHRRNIVFRDLKPDNIGFSSEDGTLKLFDFGLAKVLLPEDAVESDDGDGSPCYRLTKFTGAIRYLSPENGLGLPYNLKADVYSWSMLLHYILALEPPMGTYTPNMFIERVFKQGVRPVIKDKWSPVLKDLLKQAWSESIDERPSFAEIMLRLKQEIASIDAHAASFLPEPNCGEPLVIVASASK
jgi:serine/threonine protein kinase